MLRLLALLCCLAPAWRAAAAPAQAPQEPTDKQIHADLLNGDTARREAAVRQILSGRARVDASLLDAFEAAATDPSPNVRSEVARTALGPLIWSAKEQNPRAIALAIKLADDPHPSVVGNAIYFGLSTVREPSDDVIRAMLKVAARAKSYEAAGDLGRIAWGLKSVSRVPAERLVPLFEAYWAKADTDPKPAFMLVRLFKEATGQDPPNPQRFADLERRVAELDEAHRRAVIAANANLVADLADGDSATRMKAFRQIYSTPDLFTSLDPTHLEAIIKAATDEDERVRREVARVVGGRWTYGRDASPKAMDLLIRLARDPEHEVRYDAVYHGLSTTPQKTDEVIRAMIDAALLYGAYENNLYGRVAWSLNFGRPDHARLQPLFAPYLADPDAKRAKLAAMLYIAITKQPPAGAEAVAAELLFAVPFAAPEGQRHDAAALLEQFRSLVPEDAYTEVFIAGGNQGLAIARGLAGRTRLVDLLANTPQLGGGRPRGDGGDLMFVTPEMLAAVRKQYPTRHASNAGGTGAVAKDDPRYAETFRELYDHLGRVYPAFRIKGIDWKKVGDELLPRAKDVKDDQAFGKLVLELVARLEDSHAGVQPGSAQIPPIEFPRYDPGFACLVDDRDRPVVYHVDRGSPADSAGVKVGMTVLSVNGQPAAEAIRAWMDRQRTYVGYSSERYLRYDAAKGFCRQMKQGEVVKLELEDVAGAKHAFELPAAMDVRYLPRLPVPIEGIDDSGSVEAKNLGDGIGYIYVRRIKPDLPQGLDAALAKLGDIKGLIIDVRGNSGGGFDARAAVRNFNPDDAEEPSRPRYKGPIALLVDERCISAGEGWASWFVATKRAKLFGTATAGASSRKAPYALSNGRYSVVVPVKAYTGSLDRPIERRGLEPDVPVRCTASDLAAGRDTVLEAARRHLLQPPD